MKNKLIYKSVFLLLSTLSLFSCGKKKVEMELPPETLVLSHNWYYINADGFNKINSPKDAPLVMKKPYTEACRISGIGQTVSLSGNKNAPVYAIVNHSGVIEFNNAEATLYSDKLMFKDFTADGIVFMNDNPVFSFYKDSFFNDTLNSQLSSHTEDQDISVLVQFDVKAKTFFPILNTETLKLTPTSQVTDYYWDGNYWYYCIKDSKADRTEFSYIQWNPNTALLSILPNDPKIDSETNIDKKTKVELSKSSEDKFRKLKQPRNYSEAPERVKKLLAHLAENFAFSVNLKTAGGPSPRRYENKIGDKQILEAVGQLADTWTAVMFKDGTMYFSGAISERRIINNSKPIAIRLPKLPEGFIYTDFGITGDTLYASWEEVAFYETGRSGFISVDLGQILYND